MTTFSLKDHEWMARALQLAQRGLYTTDPNPRVGCVIVQGEQIVGEGWHERAGEAHAEVNALRAAGAGVIKGATAYVTLEPCSHHGRTPPCVEPLIAAGIARVVCSMVDPNPLVQGKGIAALQAAGITVETGLMETQARELNPGFVKRMTSGLPWVRLKLGVSLDGRTALANGQSRWITGEAARRDVQHWRARSSAILTGIGTVLADDPRLDVRLPEATRQPLRVVLDSRLRTPPNARIFKAAGAATIFTVNHDPVLEAALEKQGVHIERSPARLEVNFHGSVSAGAVAAGGGDREESALDLRAVLNRLAELKANEVWVEAGPRLSGAFLRQGLVDELVIYMAPRILGSAARGMFQLPVLQSLEEGVSLQFTEIRNIGADLRIIAHPVRN